MDLDYVIHGAEISLFSRKLEAALRFYDAPFAMEAPSEDSESRGGTHQIPVLRTPENWMLADTTPLIGLLDGRYPARRLIPPGPLGVLVHVVEEILDEWYARVMVHFRWHHAENTQYVVNKITGQKLSREAAQEFPLADWGRRACRATGTASDRQQQEAEGEYLALLAALEMQLASTRYALGNRPTAVDTILLGGLRAHTNADPIPDLSAFPEVLAWDAQNADAWDGKGELAPFPETTPFAAHVLSVGRDLYAPFLLATARAVSTGEKAFVIESYGEEVSYLTRLYPLRSSEMVKTHIRNQLNEAERAQVGAWLEEWDLAACFMPS